MINLIPKKEKKKLVMIFYYKLAVLFLVTGSISFLVFLISILPSYFLAYTKNNISNSKLETQKSEPVPIPDQQTLATIKDLNNKLTIIEQAEKNKFSISQKIVSSIVNKKLPAIKITDISYENDPLTGKKIRIQGTAPSREILLSFRLALENDVLFKQVDLPISNFIKGSDIQFYLSLIPS